MIDEGAELVLGNRFSDMLGPVKSGLYFWKLLPIIALNALSKLVFREAIDDFHQGFRIYTKSSLERIDFSKNSDGYLFSLGIIAQIIFDKHKTSQVNVQTHYTGKKRGASLKHSVFYSLGTFKILFLYLFSKLFCRVSIFKNISR